MTGDDRGQEAPRITNKRRTSAQWALSRINALPMNAAQHVASCLRNYRMSGAQRYRDPRPRADQKQNITDQLRRREFSVSTPDTYLRSDLSMTLSGLSLLSG
jgi:hypothetical protein